MKSYFIYIYLSFSLVASFLFVVFRPIFASAKMCINPNAEVELKGPKAQLHLEVQNISVEMTKPQVRHTGETAAVYKLGCVDMCPPSAVPYHGGAAGVH